MHKSFAALYMQFGFYSLLVAIGVVTLLVILWRLSAKTSRATALTQMKIGLVGGLIVSSDPFLWLVFPVFFDTDSIFFRMPELIHSQVFGRSPFFPRWLPNFLIGFWVTLFSWFLVKKLIRRSSSAA